MVSRGSAAFVLGIVIITGIIMGAFMLNVLDPFAQGLMNNPMWSANTVEGQNLLSWFTAAWAFVPVAILVALLLQIQIDTRNPQ